jgi:hypothetical protein
VGLNSLKSLNLTNGYPNKNKNNKNKNKNKNNKVKSKPLELRSRVKITKCTKSLKTRLKIPTVLNRDKPYFRWSYCGKKREI